MRKIQRFFRNISKKVWFQTKHGQRGVVKKASRGKSAPGKESYDELTVEVSAKDDEDEDVAIAESQASFWSRAGDKSLLSESQPEGFGVDTAADQSVSASVNANDGFLTPAIKRIRDNLQMKRGGRAHSNGGGSSYGELSALRLADLQRRVGMAAYEGRREKERKDREAAYAAGVAGGKPAGGGGVRRGYEKLIEVQALANQRLMEMSMEEEQRKGSKERRQRRLQRFDRMSSMLQQPPALRQVEIEAEKRRRGNSNDLKKVLSGWRLPRSDKSWAKAKKAHESTVNALSKKEEWWSLNLGEKFGGGTYDLREMADFDVDNEDGEVGPMVGKYDADESSLFWYLHATRDPAAVERGGDDGVRAGMDEFIYERTKTTGGEKMEAVDAVLAESKKRERMLALNVNKVLGREQQMRAAPGALGAMKEGRAKRM